MADITYVPTWAGFGYLATVLDVFSRRIVGWSYATHMRTELIVDAIDMVIETRRPPRGLIHHSDRLSPLNTAASRSGAAATRPGSCCRWDPAATGRIML